MKGFETSWVGLKRILKSLEELYSDKNIPEDVKQTIIALLNQCQPHELKYIEKNMSVLMSKINERDPDELRLPSIFIKQKIQG